MTFLFAALGSRPSARPSVARGRRLGALLGIVLAAGVAGAETQAQRPASDSGPMSGAQGRVAPPARLAQRATGEAAATTAGAASVRRAPSTRGTRVEPSEVPAGSDATDVRVNGQDFTGTTRVLVNGAPVHTDILGPTQLQVRLPSALTARAGRLDLRVVDAGQESADAAALVVTVVNPVPRLDVIEVPALLAGEPAAHIRLIGKAFRPDSTVQVAGKTVETAYRSPEELIGTIPADLLAAPGTLPVSVVTPGPGGGASLSGQITVTEAVVPGRFVVFTSNRRQGRNHVYILDRRGNRLDALQEANSPNGTDAYPSISADGRFIAFQSDRHRGQYDIFLFDREMRTLDSLPEANHRTAFDGFPAISADGRFIVFESDRQGKPTIFLFDLRTRVLSELDQANEKNADDGLAAISN